MEEKSIKYSLFMSRDDEIICWGDYNGKESVLRQKVHIIGYGKKKRCLLDCEYIIKDIGKLEDKICKCVMLIIRSKNVDIKTILYYMQKYSYENNCYAPIVYTDCNEVLYFPQLSFQDSYLLEDILNGQFEKDKYHILYANKSQLLTFV